MKHTNTISAQVRAYKILGKGGWLSLLFFLSLGQVAHAQTDREFWFSIPEINRYHSGGNEDIPCNDGTPTSFRITTLNTAAKIKISMPADPSFTPIRDSIPANTLKTFNIIQDHISDFKIPTKTGEGSMENRLRWVQSDMAHSSYINRNNKGILIESDNLITVYYEIGALANKELLTLKGRNALGTEFYVPFQTEYSIINSATQYPFTYRPYSSFDIVATENETEIEITVPHAIWLYNAKYNEDLIIDNQHSKQLPKDTYKIKLNRGETSIIAPYEKQERKIGWRRYFGYQTNNNGDEQLAGARVKVVKGGPVAVITKQDMILGNPNGQGGVDYIADQLVPIDHIGTEYAVMKGRAQYNKSLEYFYIVGTKDSTTVTIKFDNNQQQTTKLNAGEQSSPINLPSNANVASIHSTQPIYVYHQSGVGVQLAGALVPTISVCTGSNSVAFNRTMGDNHHQECPCKPSKFTDTDFLFFLNIMVYEGAEDGFKLLKNGVEAPDNEWKDIIKKENFKALPTINGASRLNKYKYLRAEFPNIEPGIAYTLVNTKNIFHLGVINGAGYGYPNTASPDADAFYGYFSNFNKVQATGYVGVIGEGAKKICSGDSSKLIAWGGSTYHWYKLGEDNKPVWPNYLRDTTEAEVWTTGLPQEATTHTYRVVVGGACDQKDSTNVQVKVGLLLNPGVKADKNFACGAKATFVLTDTSGNAGGHAWYRKNPGETRFTQIPKSRKNTLTIELTAQDTLATWWIHKRTSDPLSKCFYNQIIALQVCNIEYDAQWEGDVNNTNHCHPFDVQFTCSRTAGDTAGITYQWTFGDGSTSTEEAPKHTYKNFTDATQTYNPQLIVINHAGCSDTVNLNPIKVEPFLHANIATDPHQQCAPATYEIIPNCTGGFDRYQWYINKTWQPPAQNSATALTTQTANVPQLTATQTDTIILRIWTPGFVDNRICTSADTQIVVTYPTPTVTNVTFTPTSAPTDCSPMIGNLTATVTGTTPNTQYIWQEQINNGAWVTIGNTPNINDYTINNFGQVASTHKFRLTVTNPEHGCAAEGTSNLIAVQPYIEAKLLMDTTICAPDTITAEILQNTGIQSLKIDWGDGTAQVEAPTKAQIKATYQHDYPENATTKTYTATLTVWNKENYTGCQDADIVKITVYPAVTSSFTCTPTSGCAPLLVKFTNNNVQTTNNYLWQFGDNTESFEPNQVDHEYSNSTDHAQTFTAKLITTSTDGHCTDTSQQDITVHPFVEARISIDTSTGCSPLKVNFSYGLHEGIDVYYFDWNGDGTSDQNILKKDATGKIAHEFTNTGSTPITYNVILTVANASCQKSDNIGITVYPEVEAGFTPADITDCAPMEVTFTNTSQYKDGQKVPATTRYYWTFGDGNSSIEENPTHIFENIGQADSTRTVRLTVTTPDGCSAQTTGKVTVHPFIQAELAIDTCQGCSPVTITFKYRKHKSITSYTFDWNDGSTAQTITGDGQDGTGTITHTFTNTTGTRQDRNVQLTIANDHCTNSVTLVVSVYPPITANFTMDHTTGCSPLVVKFTNTSTYQGGTAMKDGDANFYWDFGDGNSSLEFSPTHSFRNVSGKDTSYTITLHITTQTGCQAIVTQKVTVKTFVEAKLANNISKGCSPLTVNFEYSRYAGVTDYSFDWNGDGTLDEDDNTDHDGKIEHTFNNTTSTAPPINVIFKISNDNCSDQDTVQITVYPEITAQFTQTPDHGCEPLEVDFTNASIFKDAAHTALTNGTYFWDFGNGTTSSQESPQDVIFANSDSDPTKEKTFTVKLKATSEYGCADSTTRTITVYNRVVAQFGLEYLSHCTPFNVKFDPSTTLGATTYNWTFGGAPGLADDARTDNNPFEKTFTNTDPDNPKEYTVTLTVDNGKGCQSTQKHVVKVNPIVTANFAPDLTAGCSDLQVNFTNNSTGGPLHSKWDFGNGQSAANDNKGAVAQTFINRDAANKTYTVKLRVNNSLACADSTTTTITVYPKVEADFAIEQPDKCTPFNAILTNKSLNGNEFQWDFGYPEPTHITKTTTDKNPFEQLFDNDKPNTTQTYNITLRALDNVTTCENTITKKITVDPRVVAKISTADPTAGCTDLTVNFTNQSTGAQQFIWDFGDSTSSVKTPNATHTFVNPSTSHDTTYHTVITATNHYGCPQTDTIKITVYNRVEAHFGFEYDSHCTPFNITFKPGALGATAYNWDFGGAPGLTNETRTDNTPFDKLFTNPDPEQTKYYTVTLNVENQHHCPSTVKHTVEVFPIMVAKFTAHDTIGCSDLEVKFDDQSTGGKIRSTWDFDNGQSTANDTRADVTHIFGNRSATDSIYHVKLKIANLENGCVDSMTQNIIVWPKVEAKFEIDQLEKCTPFNVMLSNKSLNGNEFNWDFGYPEPTHLTKTTNDKNPFEQLFDNPTANDILTYDITLHALDTRTGCQNTIVKPIVVYPRVIAKFGATPDNGCSDLQVTFDDQSTGGKIRSTWDFDNGQSTANDNQNTVTHTFGNRSAIDSIYNVKLRVVNLENGCADSLIHKITVYSKVEASFTFDQQDLCTPFNINLNSTSLNGNTYTWIFNYANKLPNDTITKTNDKTLEKLIDNPTDNDILEYTIKHITSDSKHHCADTTSSKFTVFPRVITKFDVDVTKGCTPLHVNFTNLSTGLGLSHWDFGDGSVFDNPDPSTHIYTNTSTQKTYPITASLTTTNQFGCTSTMDTLITVFPLIKAQFTYNLFEGCTPLTVNLNNASTSPLYNYLWDFGDGTPTTTNEQPGSHTYINTSNTAPLKIDEPVITLAVDYTDQVNNITCSDTMKLPIKVFPHIYPKFSGDFEGCTPHTVQFTDQSITFSNKTNYYWNLGNGVHSIEQNPKLTYSNTSKTNDSIFTVQLITVSEHNCSDSVEEKITVHPRPYAAMELVGEYISCPMFNAEFTNNSQGTNLTFYYDFGDGSDSTTTSQLNMEHIFGNPNNETQPYTIQLKVVSEFGCDDSVSQTLYVYPEVEAHFSMTPDNKSCSPFTINFDSKASKNAKFFEWNFGDSITSSLTAPQHMFFNFDIHDRIFNVILYASSAYGCSDLDTQQVTIYATPIANIDLSPTQQKYPADSFAVRNLTDPAADTWTYHWDFGDAQYSDEKDPGYHKYLHWAPKGDDTVAANQFKYFITMVVQSPHCADTATTFVYLLPPDPIPEFSTIPDSSCAPMEVIFNNTSEYAIEYHWDFDDGHTSTEREPKHVFEQPGYYRVMLTVIGDDGKKMETYKTLRVYKNPTARFIIEPSHVMLPEAKIRAYNMSEDFSRCLWDFGDTQISDETSPIHIYDKIGEYAVMLWVYKDYANDVCVDSMLLAPGAWVEGKGIIRFPNAFQPKKDGPSGGLYDNEELYRAEIFHPYHYGVTEYKLIIMSRWGEQLFTSNDVNIGWDGYVNGKLANQGVYIWRCVGRFTNNKPFDLKGSVTLIR